MMTNFYIETINALKKNNKDLLDVMFVSDGKKRCAIEEFMAQIKDKTYDDRGVVTINERLMVVGIDWWLERVSGQGSEWWNFQSLPKRTRFTESPTLEIFDEWSKPE